MMLQNQTAQAFFKHMRVDLRRRDVGMSEELLNCTKVGTAVEQMARECMPQHVGADPPWIEAGGKGKLLELLRKPLPGEMPLGAP